MSRPSVIRKLCRSVQIPWGVVWTVSVWVLTDCGQGVLARSHYRQQGSSVTLSNQPADADNIATTTLATNHSMNSRQAVGSEASGVLLHQLLEDEKENSVNDKKPSKKQRLQRRKDKNHARDSRKNSKRDRSGRKGSRHNGRSKNIHSKIESSTEFTPQLSSMEKILESERPFDSSAVESVAVATNKDVYTRMLQLEAQLLKEIIKNRELRRTLSKHSQWLGELNDTLAVTGNSYAGLKAQVTSMEEELYVDRGYHQSIEKKLAGVMLDITEMNNLISTQNKRKSVTLKDKMIAVQAPSQQRHCSLSPDTPLYRDCDEVYQRGHKKSGVYYITPLYASCSLPVYCDMDTPPGGWTVIQRRQDGSTDFLQDWQQYRLGFGDVTDEYWLGNDNLFLLTNQAHYQLRVDLWDFYGSRVYADYLHFKVEGERDLYRLHLSNHSGTAPDSLGNHDGMYFSTPERDNDQYPEYHCAKEWSAGWWFSNCWVAILNGLYQNNSQVQHRGISWNDWKPEQLKRVEMKIRPSGF